jgi:hypothetical protein
MRSPSPTEEDRVRDAVEAARNRLYWVLVYDRRWEDSRWSGQSPKDEWEKGFYPAIEIARQIINDPACDSLLHKHARVPGARKPIIAALERARPRP